MLHNGYYGTVNIKCKTIPKRQKINELNGLIGRTQFNVAIQSCEVFRSDVQFPLDAPAWTSDVQPATTGERDACLDRRPEWA